MHTPATHTPSSPGSTAFAVLGGGPAGTAAAITLARAGREVLLLERLDAPLREVGETVPPALRPVLESLGLWDDFLAQGHLPSVGNLSSWGSAEPRAIDFLFSPHGAGFHLDRKRFQEMLLAAARAAGARVETGVSLVRAEPRSDGMHLDLTGESGRRAVRAGFVIDASGRGGALSRSLGIRRSVIDSLVSVVGYLAPGPGGPIASRATRIEAVENGWWYAARLPDDRLVVVYTTDGDLVGARRARTREGWEQLLAQSTLVRACAEEGGYRLEGAPRVVPASTTLLGKLIGARWLAAGDAAASYDPLSSQGILAALTMGIRAAGAATAHVDGDADALVRYTQETVSDFTRYLTMRAAYYGMEARWPDAPFWRRRHRRPR